MACCDSTTVWGTGKGRMISYETTPVPMNMSCDWLGSITEEESQLIQWTHLSKQIGGILQACGQDSIAIIRFGCDGELSSLYFW